MSEFVEQCRAEWRRLGVADPLAEEMAADLTSDLEEAEAEGVSAAEYLGGSASDPRSFAASWASERGIIPAPPNREKGRRRPRALVAFTALAAITVVIAALLLATGEPKVALDDQEDAASPSRGSATLPSPPAPVTRCRPPLPRRSSGSSWSSRSPRSASLRGCGCAGTARDHPSPRLAASPVVMRVPTFPTA